jgi:hypothetical protein
MRRFDRTYDMLLSGFTYEMSGSSNVCLFFVGE